MIADFQFREVRNHLLKVFSMIQRDILAPQITLPAHLSFAGQSFGRPIDVDMEAFFEFSFWIAEELLDLESKHAIAEGPRAEKQTSQKVLPK